MKKNNEEIRTIESTFEVDDDSRKVSGYAIVFNSESEDLGFREIIRPSAITDDVINNSDVFARFNHDYDKVLARCKNGSGSLTLEIDERGLKYSFESPKTQMGDELLEHIKRGEITGSSFAFVINKQDKESEKWEKRGETLYREIFKIHKLLDVSPVFSPAYSQTSIAISQRGKDMITKADEITAKMNELKNKFENL